MPRSMDAIPEGVGDILLHIEEDIDSLLNDSQKPETPQAPETFAGLVEKLERLRSQHEELKAYAVALSRGDVEATPPSRRNYLASGLKQLQAQLRHLTWQAQCIASGDYGQRVDFMGEFSDAFNTMIAQLRQRDEQLRAQRDAMTRVFDSVEPIFIVDAATRSRVLYANQQAKAHFGIEADIEVDTMLEAHPSRKIGGADEAKAPEKIGEADEADEADEAGGSGEFEGMGWLGDFPCDGEDREMVMEASGQWYRVHCAPVPWTDDQDAALFHFVDITEHKHRENALEHAANTDRLTGIANRRAYERALRCLWEACRENRAALCVMMFDIDHFKRCNDRYGHAHGDAVLAAFAATLRAVISRSSDVIARFGGEEFIALLPFTRQEDAMRLAQSVLDQTRALRIPAPEHPETMAAVTVSCGIACTVPGAADAPAALVRAADAALYAAKRTGRDRIVLDSDSA